MIYNLLGIAWVSSGSAMTEVWAWGGIHSTKNIVKIIPLTIFWVIWKKEIIELLRVEVYRYKLRDKWFMYFGSCILGHDITRDEDFEDVIDTLTSL